MSTLLNQFVLESREILQNLSEKILLLEKNPHDKNLIHELFRGIHTLKGNSGLFNFELMNQVLHKTEDLMVAIRDNRIPYSKEIADLLLNVLDFISIQLDEIEQTGNIKEESLRNMAIELSQSVQTYIPNHQAGNSRKGKKQQESKKSDTSILLQENLKRFLIKIPEDIRMATFEKAFSKQPLQFVLYQPEEECFFKGEDPFFLARNVPGFIWGQIQPRKKLPPLSEFDCYRCFLDFLVLSEAKAEELLEHFKFILEQIQIFEVSPYCLIIPVGKPNGGPVYGDFVYEGLLLLERGEKEKLLSAIQTLSNLSSPELWISSALRWLRILLEQKEPPIEHQVIRRLLQSIETLEIPDFSDLVASSSTNSDHLETPSELRSKELVPTQDPVSSEILDILKTQHEILSFPDNDRWFLGRLKACYQTLKGCNAFLQEPEPTLESAFKKSLDTHSPAPLREWIEEILNTQKKHQESSAETSIDTQREIRPASPQERSAEYAQRNVSDIRFGRRAEDQPGSRILKVDQTKIDRLMNLVGELVVAKNSIPYLANKVEKSYGLPDLSRELKALYANMNRISDELQDIVMKVRMVPFSMIFQRFPRLVRDVSQKLGKEVNLIMEGENIEADKNMLDALTEPLIHLLRNSLDHGIELPEEREKIGKSKTGTILLRAMQDSDRVFVEVEDDGKGIDPVLLKQKAYEKGMIDENQLETLSEKDALNLIFLTGFSTKENATDLSGRGVGMDVVKNTLEKLGGTIEIQSVLGKGTLFRLSIPLSMAVTNVMIVETNEQSFGIPMSCISETVRIPEQEIHKVKDKKTTVVRNRILPLFSLNDFLGLPSKQKTNSEGEFSVLVLQINEEPLGLIVDDFKEVIDVILKPLEGSLAKLACYAGTALLGDGSVLMVLNIKELLKCL